MIMPVLMLLKFMNWYKIGVYNHCMMFTLLKAEIDSCHTNQRKLSLSQVPNFEFLSEKLMNFQTQHNELIRGSNLDLVFFRDAMTHLVKVRLQP